MSKKDPDNFGIHLQLFSTQTLYKELAQTRRAASSPTRPHSRGKPNTIHHRPPPEQTHSRLSVRLSAAPQTASGGSSRRPAGQSQPPTVQFSPFPSCHWRASSRGGSLPRVAIGCFSRLRASHLNTPPRRRRSIASQSVKVRRDYDGGAETHNGGGGESLLRDASLCGVRLRLDLQPRFGSFLPIFSSFF